MTSRRNVKKIPKYCPPWPSRKVSSQQNNKTFQKSQKVPQSDTEKWSREPGPGLEVSELWNAEGVEQAELQWKKQADLNLSEK